MIKVKNYGLVPYKKSCVSDLAKELNIESGYFCIVNGRMVNPEHDLRDNDEIEFFHVSQKTLLLGNDQLSSVVLKIIPKNKVFNFVKDHLEIDYVENPEELKVALSNYVINRGDFIYIKNVVSVSDVTKIFFKVWENEEQLEAYGKQMEFLQSIDHRALGTHLDLFHFSNISPGIAFWHPKGFKLWKALEEYIRHVNQKYGCDEIKTPLVANADLWENSGHLDKYNENIFTVKGKHKQYILRPMNCPTCMQVFNYKSYSYKNLPVRLTEFGIVHRNEPSGALHGLFRSKSFTQDDGHIFCQKEQVGSEIFQMMKQSYEVYEHLGFPKSDISVKIALRPKERIGSEEEWDIAEKMLITAVEDFGVSFDLLAEEGAFYGPKIEFHIKDSIGRSWQCGTIQLDLMIPKRLMVNYTNKDSAKEHPVIIHRAVLGSMERFIGILLEHYEGKLPIWLSPVQIVIASITCDQHEYVLQQAKILLDHGVRVSVDNRSETLSFKLRYHTNKKIPLIAVVGKNEQEQNNFSVKDSSGNNTMMDIMDIIRKCKEKNYYTN